MIPLEDGRLQPGTAGARKGMRTQALANCQHAKPVRSHGVIVVDVLMPSHCRSVERPMLTMTTFAPVYPPHTHLFVEER